MGTIEGCPFEVLEEDLLRAQVYGLLARLLASPPDRQVLDILCDIDGDASPLGLALTTLAKAARSNAPETLGEEYDRLFVGLTRGELVPYTSFYLTGFLNEKPLADLRGHLSRLGIAGAPDQSEPEDHIAALCEVMHGLATGVFGKPAALSEQRAFFDAHIAPWAGKFFEDLESHAQSDFYKSIGAVGQRFMAVEAEAFKMAA
ncbi:MAG: TorD/DmsD family molecular chaperone [Alphaproteobacteria bacterium]